LIWSDYGHGFLTTAVRKERQSSGRNTMFTLGGKWLRVLAEDGA
jgi:hypothetical protein